MKGGEELRAGRGGKLERGLVKWQRIVIEWYGCDQYSSLNGLVALSGSLGV